MSATQEISHPRYHDAVRGTDPCPVSIHSFDRSKVEEFVRLHSKLAKRVVTTSVELFRTTGGLVVQKFNAVSRPKVKDKACGIDKSGRGFQSLREREAETVKAKRK